MTGGAAYTPLAVGSVTANAGGVAPGPATRRPSARSERTAPPGMVSGQCFSTRPGEAVRPSLPVPCNQPHLHEVIKVIDLNRLLGRPAGERANTLSQEACRSEFERFTGLGASTPALGLTIMLTRTPATGAAWAACLASSRTARSGSARGVAR
ncbi:MAG: septum formation family protein [Actinobacteria bacterium]|nr:septum formation family protein [Actinomycetota bacterium]MCA1719804.1 septum formation family protein [Actinomycetota bacterium]